MRGATNYVDTPHFEIKCSSGIRVYCGTVGLGELSSGKRGPGTKFAVALGNSFGMMAAFVRKSMDHRVFACYLRKATP